MVTKPKMKRTPKVDLEKLDDFAEAANKTPAKKPEKETAKEAPKEPKKPTPPIKESKPPKTGSMPWEQEGVSDKVLKPFNLRTNQVQIEQLKYIVDNTAGYKSVHAFCMEAVKKAMEKQLKKLAG